MLAPCCIAGGANVEKTNETTVEGQMRKRQTVSFRKIKQCLMGKRKHNRIKNLYTCSNNQSGQVKTENKWNKNMKYLKLNETEFEIGGIKYEKFEKLKPHFLLN